MQKQQEENSCTVFSWPQRCADKTPMWIAAHSPISKFDLNKAIQLFEKYEAIGVPLLVTGEIILDNTDSIMNGPVIRFKCNKGSDGAAFGFRLLGPAKPNLLSAKEGVKFCKAAVKQCTIPIVANIGYLGQSVTKTCEENLKKLIDTGICAFEIALSCPTLNHNINKKTYRENNFKLVDIIRKYTNIPIALKIGHQNLMNADFKTLFSLCDLYKISQITTMDGIKLICPPVIDEKGESHLPFDNYPALCHTGTYGPWNRFLLYNNIEIIKNMRDKYAKSDIKISAVGGIMTTENVFEAMSLGADSVQLSSVVFWEGINKAKRIIADVQKKLATFNASMENNKFVIDVNVLDGLKRKYGNNYVEKWNEDNIVAVTDLEKCNNCGLCCNTPCLAREFKANKPVTIKHLCSGCGWCKEVCPQKAIHMKRIKEG